MNDTKDKNCPIVLTPGTYSSWRQSELGQITDQLEEHLLFELAGDARGLDVLDVGCGDGRLTSQLAQLGAHAVGIDPSEQMLAAANRRATTNRTEAQFRRGKAERMPFKDAAFDLVVANTILCFVEDATKVFAEISRVLRPNGRLVIGELGRWSVWALQRYVRGRLGSPLWQHGNSWTASRLRALASEAGLSVTAVRGAVFYPRALWAARIGARFDRPLGKITTLGAAYIAMAATKIEVKR